MSWEIRQGGCLEVLAGMDADSIDCICTSPPYWGLRDYGDSKAWGLEPTLDEYLERMRLLGESLMRVLKPSGTFWLNMGDAYASAWPCSRRNQIGNGSLENGKRENRRSRLGGGDNKGAVTEQRNKTAPNLKEKDLIGLPWRVAFLLQAQGWYLRSEIIWHKPNPMPESVRDRPTKAHEQIFLLTKSPRYYYDADAIAEKCDPAQTAHNAKYAKEYAAHTANASNGQPGNVNNVGIHSRPIKASQRFGGPNSGLRKKECPNNSQPNEKPIAGEFDRFVTRNARSVWTISTTPYPDAHFATFPEELPKRCILAGCPEGGTVLDPFAGSGTTVVVALGCGRSAIGIEINPTYVALAHRRLGLFAQENEFANPGSPGA